MNVFEDFKISDLLKKSIKRHGFTKPTKIQYISIPHIMEGKDVVGESATGSGKTLAFGCGIIDKVVPKAGLQALVMTPTRELAEQVKMDLKKLSAEKPLLIISIYGGVAIEPQMRDLRKAEVVVATPGRLLDHFSRGTIDTSKIKILVLDEADRMLDMGFIDDVERIIKACPKDRQTLLFSATMLPQIKALAARHMKDSTEVMAGRLVDPTKLTQVYYDVTGNLKLSLLIHLLQHERSGLVMVFCNSRINTDFLVKNLSKNGINAVAIHGGHSQNKRSSTMKEFNDAKMQVLVCTDVAARGLHIPNVSHIYNYDIPSDPNDYVHRIGRTARAGESGKVVNLLCDRDHDSFSRLMRDYSSFSIKKVERPNLKRVIAIRIQNPRRPQGRMSRRRPPYR
ncbi:MAG: DEAD/DEAH box helicase [Nanoarchaeota archaeon]|nr:DEAD/DEAH box helicase [Nanoarchaeota archaeon]